MTDFIPPMDKYKSALGGMYGEFGTGGNVQARYLQIVLQPGDIKQIDLIADIKGSEKWPIQDLFQRIVDNNRVENEIIPYLRNREVVKFFNPISLIALPMDKDNTVFKDFHFLPESDDNENKSVVIEYPDYYKLEMLQERRYARFRWDSSKTRIVAIDGQHRLTAMRRIIDSDDSADIHQWTIPAVLIVMTKDKSHEESSNLLEVARKIFLYINENARLVSDNRKILLDDEQPGNIFVQELLQKMHENDSMEFNNRKSGVPPLLMVDWRGETEGGEKKDMPTALFEVTELKEWIEYLLGEDFGECQEQEIAPSDFMPPINFEYGSRLSSTDTQKIRVKFRNHILPGIMKFLQEIKPYKEYISEIYKLEKELTDENQHTASRHAFDKLRFGQSNHIDSMNQEVDKLYHDICNNIAQKKNNLPHLFKLDIGPRALFYAFGVIKERMSNHAFDKNGERLGWLNVADSVLPAFNQVISDGWLNVDPGSLEDSAQKRGYTKKQYDILEYIAFDANGAIINYRVEDSSKGLGGLVDMLVMKELVGKGIFPEESFRELWNDEGDGYKEFLRPGIEKNARKMWRSKLKDNFEGSHTELTDEISKQAKKTSAKKISALEKEFFGTS